MAQLDHELMPGDGVVFEGDRIAGDEIGGRIYQVFVNGKLADSPQAGRVELAFQRGLIEPDLVKPDSGFGKRFPSIDKTAKSDFRFEAADP